MIGSAPVRIAHGTFALALVILFASADGPTAGNSAAIPELRPLESWKKRHETIVERSKKGNVDVLFAGDSITQRWETDGKSAWEESFAAWKPANIGVSGDRTQHLLWRIGAGKELAGIEPKVIVLLIGTNNVHNNSPAEIAAGVKALLAEFRKQKPKAEILLLGIFPRAGEPVLDSATSTPADALSPKVAAINALLAKLEDDAAVTFLDLAPEFLDDAGGLPKSAMPDYLHLSEDGYRIWARALEKPVGDLMAGRPSPKRIAKAAWRRVDASRRHIMMWLMDRRP